MLIGSIGLAGTITAGDTITITIASPGVTATTCPSNGLACYTYTVVSSDTLVSITQNLANLINGTAKGGTPDPNVIATADIVGGIIYITELDRAPTWLDRQRYWVYGHRGGGFQHGNPDRGGYGGRVRS